MNKNIITNILKITAVFTVFVGVYAALTLGQAVIHTDTSTSNRLFLSIVENKSLFPSSWNYNNAEIKSFNVIPIAMLVQALIPNPIISRVIASAIILLLATACVFFTSKLLFDDMSYTIVLPIIFVLMCSENYRDEFLYQAEYVRSIIPITLCFALAYKLFICNEKNIMYFIIHSILLFLMMLGGSRYIVEYIFPFLCIIFIKFLKQRNLEAFKSSILSVCGIFVPAILGYGLYKFIFNLQRDHMYETALVSAQNISLSPKHLLMNTVETIKNLFNVFGYSDSEVLGKIVAVVLSVTIFVIIPLLQVVDYKKLSEAEKAYTVFGLVHNILMLGAIIVGNMLYERYLLSNIYVAAVISANYIFRRIINKKEKLAILVVCFSCVLSLVYSVRLVYSTRDWQAMVESQKEECQTLIDKGITKVYASYWVAYPHEVYSNNKLTAAAITIKPRLLQKFYRLADDSAFEKSEGRSCILMTKEEAEQCSNAVYIMCGQQDEDFVIENAIVSDNAHYYTTDLVAFVFDRDIADDLSNGFKDGVLGVKDMDFNWYGIITEGYKSILLDENGLVHGPYSYLEKGHYTVKIEGNNLVGCNCAVVSDNSQNDVSSTVTSIDENCIEIDLVLSRGVEDLQVCLSNNMTDKSAEFYDVLIEKH